MNTIYLRFADRAEALSTLVSVLGFDPEQDPETGKQIWTTGLFEGERYHLTFLADAGVPTSGDYDHVNLLWLGPPEAAPDVGAYVVTPATPSCVFES